MRAVDVYLGNGTVRGQHWLLNNPASIPDETGAALKVSNENR